MSGTGKRGRPPKNPGLKLVEQVAVLEDIIQDNNNKGEHELSIDEIIEKKIEEKFSALSSDEILSLVKELDKDITSKINKVTLRYLIAFMENGLSVLKKLEAVANKENN